VTFSLGVSDVAKTHGEPKRGQVGRLAAGLWVVIFPREAACSPFVITYTFRLEDGQSCNFEVDLDRASPPRPDPAAHAAWTKLDFQQCPGCPLQATDHPCCPAALDIERIVQTFASLVSHQEVAVEVHTAERTTLKRTDAQTALRSLLGLILASGGCPILSRMKGPARLHLPFATFEETLFRMVGAYLVGQYLTTRQGGAPDWDLQGLSSLYGELQQVNTWLTRRLDVAAKRDANINAVVSLMTISALVAMSIDGQLSALAPFAIHPASGANEAPGSRGETPPTAASAAPSPASLMPDAVRPAKNKVTLRQRRMPKGS
jgi:hypothetical protein